MAQDKPVTLAAIAGAHGVTGEVRLKLFGDGLSSLQGQKSFNAGALNLKKIRDDNKGGAIARFAEIADRNGAEKLRGTLLTLPRSALPPLGEGEYYHADLIGLPVHSTNGAAIGTVETVENFGAGDVVEIRRQDGKLFMVPMRPEAVPSWDDQKLVISEEFIE